jgi:hypothetical protein
MDDAVCQTTPNHTKVAWVGATRRAAWPPAPAPPLFARTAFDDSAWRLLDVPHDFVVEAPFSSNATDMGRHAYLPRDAPGWYRKHFTLPAEWIAASAIISLRFDGVFHTTEAYLDGVAIALGRGAKNGYTSFTSEDLSAALYRTGAIAAAGAEHVLAMRVDASFGSGHWYEGGGIYRNAWIVAAPRARIATYGVFAPSLNASALNASVEITSALSRATMVGARWTLRETWGAEEQVGQWTSAAVPIAPNATTRLQRVLNVATPARVAPWTVQDARLYRLSVEALDGSSGAVVDAANVTTAFRSAVFSAERGFALNGERIVLRGFSNHNSFAGVGTAVPQRVNLFRVQMARALGANAWRMTHNPGDPATYELFDRLGVVVWDENRDYGAYQAGDMGDMVRRDRNHPSIVVWSMCNEDECYEQAPEVGEAYRAAARAEDETRPLSGNLLHDSSGSMIDHLDVVGVSHGSTLPAPWTPSSAGWYDPRYGYAYFHAVHPTIPLVASEGSSCNSQRGVNVVDTDVNATGPSTHGEWDDVHNADCMSKLYCPGLPGPGGPAKAPAAEVLPGGVKHDPGACTQAWTTAYERNGTVLPFFAGNLGVWTLFDYFGEPSSKNRAKAWATPSWPQVSCNFGSFDLAGFAKVSLRASLTPRSPPLRLRPLTRAPPLSLSLSLSLALRSPFSPARGTTARGGSHTSTRATRGDRTSAARTALRATS